MTLLQPTDRCWGAALSPEGGPGQPGRVWGALTCKAISCITRDAEESEQVSHTCDRVGGMTRESGLWRAIPGKIIPTTQQGVGEAWGTGMAERNLALRVGRK